MKSGTLTKVGLGAAAAAAITPAALPAAATAARTKTYKGALERTDYSNVRVTIKVTGKKIKSLSVSANPEDQQSYQRESYALPLLRREALKAQSYKVHTISGVTTTSEAFVASLYSAMRHAHLV
ncbi:MAG: FMN-binding protein [Solirubrobacteraceae bacterium]